MSTTKLHSGRTMATYRNLLATDQDLIAVVNPITCTHTAPDLAHADITSFTTLLYLPVAEPAAINLNIADPTITNHKSTSSIGFIVSHLINKPSLPAGSGTSMWQSCQIFDTAHSPEAKLHKVERYLNSECFHQEKQALIEAAGRVLYVQKVYLEPEVRGRGLGLVAVVELVRQIEEKEGWEKGRGSLVVLLEPGPVTLPGQGGEWEPGWIGVVGEGEGTVGAAEATEKLARHWAKMGFEAWSYTDEAWMCLAVESEP